MLWMSGVVFQFLTQRLDVSSQVFPGMWRSVAPGASGELCMSKGGACVSHEHREKIELSGRKMNFPPIAPGSPLPEIEFDIAGAEQRARFVPRGGRPAQYRAHTGHDLAITERRGYEIVRSRFEHMPLVVLPVLL